MGRLFFHLSKGAAESGSTLFIIIVLLLIVAYNIYRNWDSITSSKLVSKSIIDKNRPYFTKRDVAVLNNTKNNYMILVRGGVVNDINDIEHKIDTSLMYKDLKTVSERELRLFYDSYLEIVSVYEEIIAALYDAKHKREIYKVVDAYREARECTSIIKKRVETFTNYALN